MASEDLHERLRRIVAERARIAREEADVKVAGQEELDRVIAEIEALEERREFLEGFLGISDTAERLPRGAVASVCFEVLARHPDGLTAGQVKDIVEREHPTIRSASVGAALSYQAAQGRLLRDGFGRYSLIDRSLGSAAGLSDGLIQPR